MIIQFFCKFAKTYSTIQIFMSDSELLHRLEGIDARFQEVSTLITDPDVIADMKRYVKLSKEYKDLERLVATTNRYRKMLKDIDDAKEVLETESDEELRELAKEDIEANTSKLAETEEEIKLLLIPEDPEDDRNAVVEIRGGTGGDEAAIFAGDLFRMYTKYCEMKGWHTEVSSFSEGASGGYKEIIFTVTGEKVYGTLKYESGVHRVQRVPATETQGRVHTSAASVAVLPETRLSRVSACVICGTTLTLVSPKRYLLSVPKPATSQRTRNAHCRDLEHSSTTKNTRSISMI